MALAQETIKLQLDGMSDIMFDQFYGQEKDTRPPEQKLYLEPKTNKLVFPTENIYAFSLMKIPRVAPRVKARPVRILSAWVNPMWSLIRLTSFPSSEKARILSLKILKMRVCFIFPSFLPGCAGLAGRVLKPIPSNAQS